MLKLHIVLLLIISALLVQRTTAGPLSYAACLGGCTTLAYFGVDITLLPFSPMQLVEKGVKRLLLFCFTNFRILLKVMKEQSMKWFGKTLAKWFGKTITATQWAFTALDGMSCAKWCAPVLGLPCP